MTKKELYDLNLAEIQSAKDAHAPVENDYITDRIQNYPEIGDQLDALYHAGVFPEEMTAKIQGVKDKYPKK
jgi:hypothetical protein